MEHADVAALFSRIGKLEMYLVSLMGPIQAIKDIAKVAESFNDMGTRLRIASSTFESSVASITEASRRSTISSEESIRALKDRVDGLDLHRLSLQIDDIGDRMSKMEGILGEILSKGIKSRLIVSLIEGAEAE
jgi:hypothetical protein